MSSMLATALFVSSMAIMTGLLLKRLGPRPFVPDASSRVLSVGALAMLIVSMALRVNEMSLLWTALTLISAIGIIFEINSRD